MINSKRREAPPQSYNERLFQGRGIRSWVHNARFIWFRRTLKGLGLQSHRVVELGCFDGRLLSFMPTPPIMYEGFDADWEGGLSRARERYLGHESWHFTKTTTPEELNRLPDGTFNVAVALETLEHVPPELVDGYLAQLARLTRGFLLVSVPNEKGVAFLAKWIAKRLFYGSNAEYSLSEWMAAVLGRMHKVERNDHKGFDYEELIQQIQTHFEVLRVEGAPLRSFPLWSSFTICVLAKTRD